MTLTVAPLSYRSVSIVDPLTGSAAGVIAGVLQTSGSGGGGGSVTQGTTPWVVAGGGAAGTAATGVVTIQGIASMTKLLVTPDSVALPANQSVNVSQINAATPLMGNGVSGTGALRVSIASDSTGQVALTAGSQVQIIPGTTGGSTMYHANVPANVTGVVVKNAPGQVFGVQLSNTGGTPGFFKLYDASSAPTAGAGTIKKTLMATGSSGGGGGGNNYVNLNGCVCATGIAYTFTTGILDNDTGVPVVGTYSIEIDYK